MKQENVILIKNLFTGLLILCALTITGFAVQRVMNSKNSLDYTSLPRLENWESFNLEAQKTGSNEAAVQIIELFDYQCPFCKEVHPVIEAIKQKYGDKVSVTYVHFPLSSHFYAYEAALAVECAGQQGGFASMHHLLFANQERLGTFPYDSLASLAGVPDLDTFKKCYRDRKPVFIVEQGISFAKKNNIKAIPSFVVNGVLVSGALPQGQLEQLIDLFL